MRVLGIRMGETETRSIDAPTRNAPGVTLRPWRDSDVPFLVETAADPRIADYTTIPRWAAAGASAWVEAQRLAALAGTGLCLAVCAPGSDQPLGGVQLMSPDWEERRSEAGYWLSDGARGRGLAFAAMRELIGYAHVELGVQRFELFIDLGNEPSRSLARRCGFQREALLDRHVARGDHRDDMELWSLVLEG